jgi:hypothetical protein
MKWLSSPGMRAVVYEERELKHTIRVVREERPKPLSESRFSGDWPVLRLQAFGV